MKGMKRRLLLISMILAVLSAAMVFGYLQSLQKPKDTAKSTTVFVALETIPARTQIQSKMVKKLQVPYSALTLDYLTDLKEITGKYAKSTIEKNEGFLVSMLVDSQDSTDELTIKIKNGYRAVSINATGESGISKLLKPGDHVDVFVHLTEKRENQVITRPELARMLLQNTEVLAIDRRLVRDGNVVEEEKETTAAFLVTLAVPVEEVGRLVLAEDIGSLKLALRSGEKEKPYTPKNVTEQQLYEVDTQTGKSNASGKTTVVQQGQTKAADKSAEGTSAVRKVAATVVNRYYTIKPGDTLMSISRMFYNSNTGYMLIKKVNGISDDSNLEIGMRIRIPVKK